MHISLVLFSNLHLHLEFNTIHCQQVSIFLLHLYLDLIYTLLYLIHIHWYHIHTLWYLAHLYSQELCFQILQVPM